ncbi:MAG: hypothetical protein Q7U02_07380 [Desulfosalsimonadaceae bacterium]|nr:hypothetical protein [Desulfosalsimonadaceae bacterium]
MATLFRRWGAHCDAAPDLSVSVDHGGKLSERIEVNKSARDDKRDRRNPSRQSII